MTPAKKPSRLSAALGRIGERLGKSAGVFLLVLLVLCGVEVAVDWNATLYEINVLRTLLRDKGEHYADLLRKAGESAVLGYDWDELDRLSQGLFDDEEVVYVRFTDFLGNTIYDRLLPDFAQRFYREHDKTSFRAYYRAVMDADIAAMARDPAELRAKMAESRHRDFIQAFNDGQKRVMSWFGSKPAAPRASQPRVLYQDRLEGRRGVRGNLVTYALGAITAENGESYGLVLVAFSTERLQAATTQKLLKGLGVTLFFVGLILVQNILARRSKLRMANLEAALKAARSALVAGLPDAPETFAGRAVSVAFAQAERIGGTVYDLHLAGDDLELMVAVPDGNGVDAAFASLAFAEAFRRTLATPLPPAERARAALAAYDASPLARPLALLIARLHPDGSVDGVSAGLTPPARLAADGETPATLDEATGPPPAHLAAPLVDFSLPASDGPLWLFDDGLPHDASRRLTRAEARAHATSADAIITLAKKRYKARQTDDILAVVLSARPVS